MNNCLILVTLIMTLSLNVYCKPFSMKKTIAAVDKTKHQNVKGRPFGLTIEGEDFDYSSNGIGTSSCSDGTVHTSGAYDGAIIGYYEVNIGPLNVFRFRVRYSSGSTNGLETPVEVYLDDAENDYYLTSFITSSTGGLCSYREVEMVVQTFTTQFHNMYFLFHQNITTGNTPSIDWFILTPY
ncbi:hypothetical protein CHUAL_013980 [Chamberlinius hualienensis]